MISCLNFFNIISCISSVVELSRCLGVDIMLDYLSLKLLINFLGQWWKCFKNVVCYRHVIHKYGLGCIRFNFICICGDEIMYALLELIIVAAHDYVYRVTFLLYVAPVHDLSLCSSFYHKHNFFTTGGNYSVDIILEPLDYWDSSKFTFTETAFETAFSQAINARVVLKLLINHGMGVRSVSLLHIMHLLKLQFTEWVLPWIFNQSGCYLAWLQLHLYQTTLIAKYSFFFYTETSLALYKSCNFLRVIEMTLKSWVLIDHLYTETYKRARCA